MADINEISLNGNTYDINVKDGKLSEEKLDENARAKLLPHVWIEEEAFDALQTLEEGMTYIVYEEEPT